MVTTTKKFMFDTVFEEEELPEKVEPSNGEDIAEIEEAPPEPTFEQEDLDRARAEGFREGQENGQSEAVAGIENKIEQTLETVSGKLTELFDIQTEANHAIARDAVSLAVAVAQKMFPGLNERNGLNEVVSVSEQILEKLVEEPRIVVEVQEGMREELAPRLEAFMASRGFEGKLTVSGSADIDFGDCRIEWSGGSAVRNFDTLRSQVDDIVQRHLSIDAEFDSRAPDGMETTENIESMDTAEPADAAASEDFASADHLAEVAPPDDEPAPENAEDEPGETAGSTVEDESPQVAADETVTDTESPVESDPAGSDETEPRDG